MDNAKAFDIWLRARWYEKDRLIEQYLRTGSFPADEGEERTSSGKTIRGAGHIDTEIKANYWYEFMQVFAPIGVFAMILYSFYGALPGAFVNSIDKDGLLNKFTNLPKVDINEEEKKVLKESIDKAQTVTNNQANGSKKRLGLPPMQRFSSNSSSGLKPAAAPVRRASATSNTVPKAAALPPKPAVQKATPIPATSAQNVAVKKALPSGVTSSKPPAKAPSTQNTPPITNGNAAKPQPQVNKPQKPLSKTVLPKTVLPKPDLTRTALPSSSQVNGITKERPLNGTSKQSIPAKPTPPKLATVLKKAVLPKAPAKTQVKSQTNLAKSQVNSASKKSTDSKSIAKPALPPGPAKKAGVPSIAKSVVNTAPSISDAAEKDRISKRAQAIKEERIKHRKNQP